MEPPGTDWPTEPVACYLCGAPPGAHRPWGRVVDGLRLVRCRSCQLVFQDPRPTVEALARFYNQGPSEQVRRWRSEGRPPEVDMTSNRERVRDLQRHQRGGRLLDVGANHGHFVLAAREAGFRAEGVELDGEAARFAREALDVPVSEGTLRDAKLPAGGFDVLTMFHCLEHLPDPNAELAEARRLLRTGGVLVVEVPNLACVRARLQGVGWRDVVPPHLTYFTPGTLRALLRKHGFAPGEHRYYGTGWGITGALDGGGAARPSVPRRVAASAWQAVLPVVRVGVRSVGRVVPLDDAVRMYARAAPAAVEA